MITGFQIRAARFGLHWSSEELGQRAGITGRTVKRLEQFESVPPTRAATLADIQKALEDAGIEFIGTPEDGPGIRLRRANATPEAT